MRGGTITVVAGSMFCHRIGQQVLMHDGTLKRIEDVGVGDCLIGPDGTVRNVTATHRGVGPMARISPGRGGKPFAVTLDHRLTLVDTPAKSQPWKPSQRGGRVVDVSVREWMTWSRYRKSVFKLFRVGVSSFSAPNLSMEDTDPYFLGVLLGDGSITQGIGVTTTDPEIVTELTAQASRYGLRLTRTGDDITWRLVGKGGRSNPLIEQMRALGVYGCTSANKFVPAKYLRASAAHRAQILAGLLDTDGSLTRSAGFDFVTKSPRLAEDIAFLARSLGLSATVAACRKTCQTGATGDYVRVYIGGNIQRVPTRIPRKQAFGRVVRHRSSLTRFDVTLLEAPEDYAGVTVDGDHRYLLDDFTVTHNSGKTEELVRRLRRAEFGRLRVRAFKHALDQRYGAPAALSSASGARFPATPVGAAAELAAGVGDAQVVGLDEAQFFDPDLVPCVRELAGSGLAVIVAGLDLDYRGQPFGPMPELLAVADEVLKLSALCVVCGADARRTQRLVADPARVRVGGAKDYEARCVAHHEVPIESRRGP